MSAARLRVIAAFVLRRGLPFALASAVACAGARGGAPRDASQVLQGADADLAGGRPLEAQRGYEEALRLAPRLLPAVRGRIEAARRRGALPAVLAEAEARAAAAPNDGLAWYALGLVRFAEGQEKTAVEALSRAAQLQPDEADYQFRLGIALFDGERFGEAKGPLSRAVQLAPRIARYRAPLAACLDRLGDHKGAMAALREVPDLSPSADEAALAVKTARALTDLFRGVPQPARGDLELALGYLLRDAPGLAVPYLDSLLVKFPELAAAHALSGLAAQRLDEAGRAVTELTRAAELAPDLPQPHLYLAELYAGRERPELADKEYAAALDRDPLDVQTLRKLGELRLSRGQAEAKGALEPLSRAAVLAQADDSLQLLAARAEIAAGRAGPARERLERLAVRRPEDAEVLLRLAQLLFEERQRAAQPARDELTTRLSTLLEKVLTLQPENAAASRMLTAIKSG